MNIISIDVKKFPKYNQNELDDLIKKAQNGCLESRDKVVESNLKLVLKILHRFKGRENEFEDLFQMGVIGLIKCINNFDVSRGLKFSTYAFPMIIGEMKRYLRDHLGSLKISRSIKENNQKILYYKDEFIKKHQKDPTIKDLAKGLQLTEEDIILALDAHAELLSFSKTSEYGDGKDLHLEEKLADKKDPIERWFVCEEIKEGLGKLSTTEKLVIEKRYFDNKIQEEIAEEMCISQAQVSRIERKSLVKLKTII